MSDTSRWPNSRVLMVSLVLAICSSLQNGYISSVLNIPQPLLEQFVNESNYQWLGTYLSVEKGTVIWSGIVCQRQVGQLVGTILTPLFCMWFGRKGTVLFNTIPLCLGLGLQMFAKLGQVWQMLLVGRFIWAVGCGVVAVIIPIFISEIAPNRFRGGLASLHGMMIGLGSFVADIAGLHSTLGTEQLWPYMFLIPILIQVVQLLILPFCPESPKDLYIRQNDTDRCLVALHFYHGNETNVEKTLGEYEEEKIVGVSRSRIPFKELWTKKELRMSVLVGMGATCIYAFGGMHIVTNYTTEMFRRNGLGFREAEYMSLVIGAIRFLAVFPSIYVVERFGRRPLLLFSSWGCVATFVLMAICFFIHDANPKNPAGVQYVFVIVTLSYAFLFSIGAQTIGTFLPSELVPTQQRSAAQSVCVQARFVFAFITIFTFLPLMRNEGGWAFLELLIPLIATSFFMQVYMPETTNRPITDILHELNTTRTIFKPKPFDELLIDTEIQPIIGSSNPHGYDTGGLDDDSDSRSIM